jgi:hypothetical protein
MTLPAYALTKTCAECPWRRDVAVGRFPPERYRALRKTCQQGFNKFFACHKSPEGDEFACVGYLMVDGENNFRVRMALIKKLYDPETLEAAGPLYGSFAEMARANGYDPDEDPEDPEDDPLAGLLIDRA